MNRIYLDHAATTPISPSVATAMQPWLSTEFGNPSSTHAEGRRAREAVDLAREVVSNALGCLFGEVVFTSSGTEAANLAIIGAVAANQTQRRRVLVGAAEHHCVLHTKEWVERLGHKFDIVPCDSMGRYSPDDLRDLDDVLLVSAMLGNNEVGSLSPISEIGARVRSQGSLFHCDATQAFPFVLEAQPWTVDDLSVDLLTFSAHKFHGPKGIGAAYVRAGTAMKPVTVGGGQERELRAGTESVANIVGLQAAIDDALANPQVVAEKRKARDAFLAAMGDVGILTIPSGATLPGHAHFRFPGIDAETLLIRLDRAGIAASSGAACSSGSLEPSHVLLACGYDEAQAKEGVRFTFGAGQDESVAELAAMIIRDVIGEIRRA